MATNRTTAYINYLLSENCYLQSQCDELSEMLQTSQSNVSSLNTFIQTAYDISENCVHVVTYDSCGNELACLNSDGAGGFIPCMRDFSDNILPCVLPPQTRAIDAKKPTKKRGLYDYPPIIVLICHITHPTIILIMRLTIILIIRPTIILIYPRIIPIQSSGE